MDFGKILDEWEQRENQKRPSKGFPVTFYDKDRELDGENETSLARRKRLLGKRPDGTIDLHGLTQDEAWEALGLFFDSAKRQGHEKILVIHGKGNHQEQGNSGILKEMVRNFIERCPFAGESGYSRASAGGAGSTWILLKA